MTPARQHADTCTYLDSLLPSCSCGLLDDARAQMRDTCGEDCPICKAYEEIDGMTEECGVEGQHSECRRITVDGYECQCACHDDEDQVPL
jgi:hypothetical protein